MCVVCEQKSAAEHKEGQLRRTTERQDRHFRQDHFATTLQIADQWFGEEGRPVTMHILYCSIKAFGLFILSTISASFDCRQRSCREWQY